MWKQQARCRSPDSVWYNKVLKVLCIGAGVVQAQDVTGEMVFIIFFFFFVFLFGANFFFFSKFFIFFLICDGTSPVTP